MLQRPQIVLTAWAGLVCDAEGHGRNLFATDERRLTRSNAACAGVASRCGARHERARRDGEVRFNLVFIGDVERGGERNDGDVNHTAS